MVYETALDFGIIDTRLSRCPIRIGSLNCSSFDESNYNSFSHILRFKPLFDDLYWLQTSIRATPRTPDKFSRFVMLFLLVDMEPPAEF
jgi:hypothetical protein